jgi:hypothetical protein
MSADELQQRFAGLSDEELIHVLEKNGGDYTRAALDIARQELASRGLTAQEPKLGASTGKRRKDPGAAPPPLVGTLLAYAGFFAMVLGLALPFTVLAKAGLGARLGAAVAAIIGGLVLLGLSEIVKQLHRIAGRDLSP